ncbi:hypothetical protein PQI64_12870 [Shewanella bicestrii]
MSEQQAKTQTRKRQTAKAAGDATVAQDPLLQTAQTQSQAVVNSDADKAAAEAEAKVKAEAEALAKEQAEQQAKQEAEQQAKEEAEAKAKADEQAKLKPTNQDGSNEKSLSKNPSDLNVTGGNALAIVGAFTVRAKADAGFWRSGVQFHRLTETLVLVVDDESAAKDGVYSPDHDAEHVVLLTREKAERVHREPNLVVQDVDLETLIDPASVIDLASK